MQMIPASNWMRRVKAGCAAAGAKLDDIPSILPQIVLRY